MKKVTLEIHESLYESVKKEVWKEKYWFFYILIPAWIVLWLMFLLNFVWSTWHRGADTCNYIFTTQSWGRQMTQSRWMDSNPTREEVNEVIGKEVLLFMRELDCKWERD